VFFTSLIIASTSRILLIGISLILVSSYLKLYSTASISFFNSSTTIGSSSFNILNCKTGKSFVLRCLSDKEFHLSAFIDLENLRSISLFIAADKFSRSFTSSFLPCCSANNSLNCCTSGS